MMVDQPVVIYVGKKPFMNYVTAVVMQMTNQNAKEVVIKARGRFISRAVDVAEAVRSRFLSGQIEVANIEIGSEEYKTQDGKSKRVSNISIKLVKR